MGVFTRATGNATFLITLSLVCAGPAGLAAAASPSSDAYVRSARSGDADAVRSMLRAGILPDATDSEGETALGWATFKGHREVVQVLLDEGADVNGRNAAGNTPVIYAAAKGHAEILELLIARGADVAVKGRSDVTPLEAAARSGHSDAVKVLVNAEDGGKQPHRTALRAAKRRGHRSVVDMIAGFMGLKSGR